MADSYDVQTTGIGGRNLPVWAAGVPHPVATLVNEGTVTLYLDQSPTAGTTGQPLSAGSSLLWDADRPLYAWTASGAGVLLVSDNTGLGFDAGAVAAQILAQGLAGQVASAIYAQGILVVDNPTQIASILAGWTAGNQYTYGPYTIRQYPTMLLQINTSTALYTGANGVILKLIWNDDAGNNLALEQYHIPCATSTIYLAVRTRGSKLTIGMAATVPQTTQFSAVLEGSYRNLPFNSCTMSPYGITTGVTLVTAATDYLTGSFAFAGTTGAAGTFIGYPSFISGDYSLSVNASTAGTIVIRDASDSSELYRVAVAANTPQIIPGLHLSAHSYYRVDFTVAATSTYSIAFNRTGQE